MRVLALVYAAQLADQSTSGQHADRAVSDSEQQHAVELMRYVTPYSTTLDVMKDVSHLGPALMNKELRGYSFVDTWASQPSKVLWQNEAQTQCQAIQPIEGGVNGFMVHAELMYFPETVEKSGRVSQVVSTDIKPTPFGSALNMGQPQVSVLQKEGASSMLETGSGALQGHRLLQGESAANKMFLNEGEVAKVFACEEASDIARSLRAHPSGASLLGLGDSFIEVAEQRTSKKGHKAWDLGNDRGVSYVSPRKVMVHLDHRDLAGWHKGAQVYAKKQGPSDAEARGHEGANHTYASPSWSIEGPQHHPIGFVESMDMSDKHKPTALVEISHGCPCEDDEVARAFRVSVAKTTKKTEPLKQVGVAVQNKDGQMVLTTADELARHKEQSLLSPALLQPSLLEVGASASSSKVARPVAIEGDGKGPHREELKSLERPVKTQSTPTAVAVDPMEGGSLSSMVEVSETSETPPPEAAAETEPVCVMRNPHDHLGSSLVDFGEATKSHERWFAHFVGTGHGWENTEAKCGEFCKAEYQLKVNGNNAGEPIRPWREDCDQNPNSRQMGTWPYPRNGWCPGAVANGHFVDVTSLVQQGGKLPVDIHLTKVDGEPVPYSNMRGFAFDDKAMFQTALTFHRYEESPEAAASLLETGESVVRETPHERSDPPFFANKGDTGRGDNGPWYNYDKDVMAFDPPLYRVPLFSGDIHEMKTRLLTTPPIEGPVGIDKDVPWRIAMRLRLEAPPRPYKGDEWDRVASIGLLGLNDWAPHGSDGGGMF